VLAEVEQDKGKNKTIESDRERERERKGKREEERVEPQSSTARSSCGTPRFPPDCFQLVLEPWAFWVLEASPDPTIPPAPHPAA